MVTITNAQRTTANIPKTMQAWAINAYGEPMRLMELPVPKPGPHDVLIRMQGAEVGDWDEIVRRGQWPMERPFPLVLGLSGAGTVAAVGDEVEDFVKDDPVYAYSYPLYDNGAWAQYMLVPLRYAAAPPVTLEPTHAGVVPIVGLTAHEVLVDILRVKDIDVVLITAAAGGVGHLAVQLAVSTGAHVIATASAEHCDFVKSFGAKLVIDYTSQDVVKTILDHYPGGVDKALNGVAGEDANQILGALREGGVVVDLPGAITLTRPDVRIINDYVVKGDGTRLKEISRLIDTAVLQVDICKIYPFREAQAALQKVLTKHVRGKVGLGIE